MQRAASLPRLAKIGSGEVRVVVPFGIVLHKLVPDHCELQLLHMERSPATS